MNCIRLRVVTWWTSSGHTVCLTAATSFHSSHRSHELTARRRLADPFNWERASERVSERGFFFMSSCSTTRSVVSRWIQLCRLLWLFLVLPSDSQTTQWFLLQGKVQISSSVSCHCVESSTRWRFLLQSECVWLAEKFLRSFSFMTQ